MPVIILSLVAILTSFPIYPARAHDSCAHCALKDHCQGLLAAKKPLPTQENNLRSSEPGHVGRINQQAEKAKDSLQLFSNWVDNLDEMRKPHYEKILRASEAALNKHLPVYLSQAQNSELDWPRMYKILTEVANFDQEKASYSAHRILRAVIGRYSIDEYIACKT